MEASLQPLGPAAPEQHRPRCCDPGAVCCAGAVCPSRPLRAPSGWP